MAIIYRDQPVTVMAGKQLTSVAKTSEHQTVAIGFFTRDKQLQSSPFFTKKPIFPNLGAFQP